MAMTEQISSLAPVSPCTTAASLSSSVKSLARFFVTRVNACADHYAAAAMYEQLSKLSNAELHKRGLSRDALVRDVHQACAMTAHG
jgi:predicted phosphoribosyltransferase